MLRVHDALLVMLLLLACNTQTAHAFFDPPWITPAAPIAGEPVSVNIRGGICDSIFEHQGYPQITREGNTIRLLEYGHHWDGELCIYDIGTLTEPIGTFLRGDYTLTVDFHLLQLSRRLRDSNAGGHSVHRYGRAACHARSKLPSAGSLCVVVPAVGLRHLDAAIAATF